MITLIFLNENWHTAGHSYTDFSFSTSFCFGVKSPYGTHRRTRKELWTFRAVCSLELAAARSSLEVELSSPLLRLQSPELNNFINKYEV